MNLKNRIAHFRKAEDFHRKMLGSFFLKIYFSMNKIIYTVNGYKSLTVFYDQTLYLTTLNENVPEVAA